MDVYFEKIAGVAEPKELREERESAPTGSAPAPAAENTALDPNGFPLTPMSDQDELWFIQAARMHTPLSRAAGLAKSSGTLMILSAVLSVIAGGLSLAGGDTMGGGITMGIGLMLFYLGLTERNGGTELAALNMAAPKRLAINQIMLLLLIAGGCVMGIQEAETAGALSMETSGLPPDMAQRMTSEMESLAPLLIYGVYGIMLAISVVVQGGMALYYMSRRKAVAMFHEELPPWVTDVVSTLQRH